MGLILSKLHFVTTIREYLTGASAVEKMFDDTDPVRHIDIVFFTNSSAARSIFVDTLFLAVMASYAAYKTTDELNRVIETSDTKAAYWD